ncbi:MAG TPA: hypothetical protein VGP99_06090 [Tepidisphaeraceae bacterium]|jgi:hypothetical protein|nr:hypothetical protein [Tepidisphaeraceae bacterium]
MTIAEQSAPDWQVVQEEVTCPLCEYNLRGLAQPPCPECGYAFKWEEVLDPSLRKHPYLFEHHPRRTVWSFLKTMSGGLRPGRFWRQLHPTQPSRPLRLFLYALIIAICVLLPLAAAAALDYSKKPQLRPGSFWSSSYRVELGWTASRNFPANLIERPLTMTTEQLAVAFVSSVLALPVLMYALLLLFQQTMRRTRVRRHHVLRCVIYSADILIWTALPLMVLVLLNFIPGAVGDWSETIAWTLLALFPILWIIMAWRLNCAYRLYLRFDHSRATIISVQLILFLLLLLII